MANEPIIAIKGLFTNPNPFSPDGIPLGACAELNNIVLSRGNIASIRGGFQAFASSLGGASAASAMKWYGNYLVAMGADGILRFLQTPATPTWQTLLGATNANMNGTLAGPGAFPMRFCESGGNLYCTSNWGVLRVQALPASGSYSVVGFEAGCPRGVLSDQHSFPLDTAGPIVADSQVAYRVIWCYKMANGRIVRGAPSGRKVYIHQPLDIQPAGGSGLFIGNGAGGATAIRLSGSSLVSVYYSDTSTSSPIYNVGDQVTVTFSDSETSTFFKSGTYTLASGPAPINFNVTDTNPGSNQSAFKIIKIRGPAKACYPTFIVPPGITNGHFYQLYRSEITNSASVTPSDEMRLIYEGYISSVFQGQSFTVNDTVSSLLAGETLYCSPSQGGMTVANQPVPKAADIAEFQSCMFYANTALRQTAKLQLLAPTPSQVGFKRMTIDNNIFDYTSTFSPVGTANQVQDIAFSLTEGVNAVWSFNSSTGERNAILAASILSPDDISSIGLMTFEAAHFGRPQFEVKTSFGLATSPPTNPVTTTGSTVNTPASIYPGVFSTDDARQNRVYFSKPQEPEHVPAQNFIDVGSINYPILRIVSVQNSLFVLKSEGIFRITGDGYDFSVEPFDLTKNIVSSESLKTMGNKAYFLATQGVVELDESGGRLISQPIETDLTVEMLGGTPSQWFAEATDLEHRYILCEGAWGTNTFNAKCWVFNGETRSWTTWIIPDASAMTVDQSGFLYLGRGTSGVGKQGRSVLAASMNDYGSQIVAAVALLPFVGPAPEQLKHFSNIKTVLGPVVTSGTNSLVMSIGFTSEQVSSLTSISIACAPSPKPQTVISSTPREYSRSTQLTARLALVVLNTLVPVYGFDIVYQLAGKGKVGHR